MEITYDRLSDHLPLDTPWTLMIDPTNRCNFKCVFCPTGDKELLSSVNRPLGEMSMELFQKIIDDLTEFPKKVRSLRLFKDGESFLNKNLVNMIRYAKERAVADEIYIISNGSLITKELAGAILDAGLDRIRISVEHVNSEKYKEITKTYSNYDRVVANVRFLYEEKVRRGHHLHINPKIVNTGLSEEEIQKFKDDFGSISDELTVETLMGWSSSEEKDWTLGVNPAYGIDSRQLISEIQTCPEPFKGMAINFDGTISVCCVDWSHGTLVGDVNHEKLQDIWNGPKMGEFRMLHLTGQRDKIKACANCHYIKGHKELSHLDHDAERLVQIFSSKNRKENSTANNTQRA